MLSFPQQNTNYDTKNAIKNDGNNAEYQKGVVALVLFLGSTLKFWLPVNRRKQTYYQALHTLIKLATIKLLETTISKTKCITPFFQLNIIEKKSIIVREKHFLQLLPKI